ncbi:hypothetical protein HUJ05_011282 [Dendroctonus ponderosae]|nr:hypothetical protein HUJ05_011282 [Dendroctonus ponderosae]
MGFSFTARCVCAAGCPTIKANTICLFAPIIGKLPFKTTADCDETCRFKGGFHLARSPFNGGSFRPASPPNNIHLLSLTPLIIIKVGCDRINHPESDSSIICLTASVAAQGCRRLGRLIPTGYVEMGAIKESPFYVRPIIRCDDVYLMLTAGSRSLLLDLSVSKDAAPAPTWPYAVALQPQSPFAVNVNLNWPMARLSYG